MKSTYMRRNGGERTKHAHADKNNGLDRRKSALARLTKQLEVKGQYTDANGTAIEVTPADAERIKKEITVLKSRI